MYKIYTHYGDKGYTKLLSGEKVLKCNEQIRVCNLIDKVNAWMGLMTTKPSINNKWKKFFSTFIDIFFLMSSEISYISKEKAQAYNPKFYIVLQEKVVFLEKTIDYMDKYTSILKNFIYPINSHTVSVLNIIRAYVRDIEINMVYLLYKKYVINNSILSFCNRLSDFFFAFSRYYTYRINKKDILLLGK